MCFKDSKSRSSQPQLAEQKKEKNLSLSVISAHLGTTLAFSPNGPMVRPHEPCPEAMSKPSHYTGAATIAVVTSQAESPEPVHYVACHCCGWGGGGMNRVTRII